MLGAETLSNKRYTDMGKKSNDDVEEEERIIKNKCWKRKRPVTNDTRTWKQKSNDEEEEKRIIKIKCWKQEAISNKRHRHGNH